jgi:predicted alpha-1,6-mannanase (GH76 family)
MLREGSSMSGRAEDADEGRVGIPCFADDHLWYVLAWLRLYQATQDRTFLNQAQTIYEDILLWGGWNTTCGGMNWQKPLPNGGSYVNAITGELFLSASGKLALLTGSNAPVTNFSYADWAQAEWNMLGNSAMMTPTTQPPNGLLITDGLSSQSCSQKNPTGAYWTYNQGVVLSGLAMLSVAGGNVNKSTAATANLIATTAMTYFNTSVGVMAELSCGNGGNCTGKDGREFKGVFVRHLAYALETLSSLSPDPGGMLAAYREWLSVQANAVVNWDSVTLSNGNIQFGQFWQGPFQWDNTPWVSQNSGLDAVLAILLVS